MGISHVFCVLDEFEISILNVNLIIISIIPPK